MNRFKILKEVLLNRHLNLGAKYRTVDAFPTIMKMFVANNFALASALPSHFPAGWNGQAQTPPMVFLEFYTVMTEMLLKPCCMHLGMALVERIHGGYQPKHYHRLYQGDYVHQERSKTCTYSINMEWLCVRH